MKGPCTAWLKAPGADCWKPLEISETTVHHSNLTLLYSVRVLAFILVFRLPQ